MAQIKIAFFDAKKYDRLSFNELNSDYKIKYFEARLSEDTVPLTEGYDVVCVFVNDDLTKSVLEQLVKNGVQLVAMRCAGYNNVNLETAYGKLHVVRVPAYSPHAVAEHAAALMLGMNRKIHKSYYRTRENNFTISGLMGFDLYQKTAAVIGTGKIGQIFIKILTGFGMNVLAYDKFPNQKAAEELGFTYASLDEIYAQADVISLHCPLNKETHHLINKESIAKMKKGIMIINTGRGSLINSKDLIKGLKTGEVGSACLDVYEEESEYFFEDFSDTGISDDVLARLLSFPNVLVTSHQAFFTKEALTNIAETTLANVKAFFDGQKLENEVCYKCDKDNCRKKLKGRCF